MALDMGFGSVDGYQRAFYREFGCNPRVTRQGPGPLLLFIPYGVKYRNLRKEPEEMENIKSVFVQMTERPSIKVILPHAGHIQICAGRGGGGGLSGTGAGGLCVY